MLIKGSFKIKADGVRIFEKKKLSNYDGNLFKQSMNENKHCRQSSKESSVFEELRQIKNYNHFQSQQRVESTSQCDLDQRCHLGVNNQSRPLTREQSIDCQRKVSSKNLKLSVISRNSSARSFFNRSQKEILSPYYKPFEILFKFRKQSLQRSQNGISLSTVRSKDLGHYYLTKTIPISRSLTPSFATRLNEDKVQQVSQQKNQRKEIKQKNLRQSYLENYDLKPKRDISRKNTKFSTFNIRSSQPTTYINKTLKSRNNKKFYRSDFPKVQSQLANTLKTKTTALNCCDDDLEYSPDEDPFQNHMHQKEQKDIFTQTMNDTKHNYESQTCCHLEAQKHQMTQFALEKALQLAEVLMKEVQRLDQLVQNQKKIGIQSGENSENEHEEIEKKQISKVKNQLFKEIENLNSGKHQLTFKQCVRQSMHKKQPNRATGNQQVIINMSLDLKPEKIKPYLKLLTEATVHLNGNKGSLRKDIWDYLNNKYTKSIDYRDFLLAIRKFLLEGKLINNDGIYQMHPEVIEEVREKTPTPVFKKNSDGKPFEANIFLKFLKGNSDEGASTKKNNKYLYSSKVSNSGKKQKVKPHQESVRQSTIEKYYLRKQISQYDFKDFEKQEENPNKKLGFATPAFDSKVLNQEEKQDKATPKKEAATKRLGIQSKIREQNLQNQLRRKILDNSLSNFSKRITKQKKQNGRENQSGSGKKHSEKKQVKQDEGQKKQQQQSSFTFIKQQQQQVEAPVIREEQEKQPKKVIEEKPTKNVIEVKKQDLQAKKEKLLKKNFAKLTGKVIKELKKAIQNKNVVMRKKAQISKKAEKKDDQQEIIIKPESKKHVSEKTKAIKRAGKKVKDIKKKVAQQLGLNKIYQKRLRGKTLDLTQLGIIKRKKVEEKPVVEQEKKVKQERGRPKKIQESVRETRSKSRSTSVQQKEKQRQRTESKDKSGKKKEQRKRVKSQQKVQPLRQESPKKQKEVKPLKKQKTQKEKKVNVKVQKTFVDLDRKAKIDAVKTLKQLFSKDKLKDDLYVDGKLIYMREEDGVEIVKKIVNEWSKVYINQVFFVNKFSNIFNYEVEFSKPHSTKPIPEGTVKVFFSIIEKANGESIIEFNFENESLKHKLDNSMRTNMFESWIDRVLENKLKIKMQLHLGTEFEYTRTVDEKGKTVDPFVPKFDIMKVKDLQKEMRKSQKVNVESPRFINTLKRALYEMFQLADKDKSGNLSYQEFIDAFKTLSYGLSENDIKVLVALADENGDGYIDWEEFIPIGIESIQTFFARNKALQRAKANERELNKEALQLVYQDEIKKTNEILLKKFMRIDEQKKGVITLTDLKMCMNQSNLITPKEINIIMRSIKEDTFQYKNFQHILFDVRFELAKSRLMDTNIDKLQEHLMQIFSQYDKEHTGVITILQVQDALLKSKKTNLTPFQVHSLIGLSKPDEHGMVNYKDFAPKCKDMIHELFTVKSLADKASLMQQGSFKEPENIEEINLSGLELFKLFKKYDRNQNGFLEIHEYIQCLKESDVKLSEQEIITLGLSADINGDGRIDYEEFMKHFQDTLRLIRVQSTLQDAYNLYIKATNGQQIPKRGGGMMPTGIKQQ